MSRRKRNTPWTPPPWAIPTGIGVVLTVLTVWAFPARTEQEPHVRDGNGAYGRRDFTHALQSYEAAPGDGVPNAGTHMDRGLARYRTEIPPGDGGRLQELGPDAAVPEGYDRAQDEMRAVVRGSPGAPLEDIDTTLRAQAAYNLGNTYFSEHSWQNAIDQYKEALRLRPGWTDAAWNLEVARRRKDEDEHPDAGQDAGQDASHDASSDASQDSGGPHDGGGQPDGGSPQPDGGSPQPDGGGGPNDGGGPQSDAGGGQNDGGSQDPHGDGGVRPPPPTSLAPLDQLERGEQDLQQMLLRRRAATMPRNPDDER